MSKVVGGGHRKLILRVPASTSNLGPGFDTLALALARYCRLTFTLLESEDAAIPFVTFKGGMAAASLPADADRLIKMVLRKLWADDPDLVRRLRIAVESDIPLGAGLGASDAIILGALWAACSFRDIVPSTATLLSEAASLEGHGENIAASLMGQFVVCARDAAGGRLIARSHPWPDKWRTIFVVPPYTARTTEARALLPAAVDFADAVANIQHACLLVSAVTGSHDLALKEALADRLHEPYRHGIAPLLPEVRELMADEPVLGVVLSGGGPSVLVIVHERQAQGVLARLQSWASNRGDGTSVLDLPVDREGIKEMGQPGRPPAQRA